MDVKDIGAKIADAVYSNAELIGIAGGALSFGLDKLIQNIEDLPTKGHMPDIGTTVKEFIDPHSAAGSVTFNGVKMWLGGWILKELGFGGGLGSALQKIGVGYIKGNALQHVLYFSTHSSGGSYGSNPRPSSSGNPFEGAYAK